MAIKDYLSEYLYLLGMTRPHFVAETDAVNVAIALFHEMNKDRRASVMMRQRALITAKQFAFLMKRGISVEPVITKEEASKLISEALTKSRNGRE